MRKKHIPFPFILQQRKAESQGVTEDDVNEIKQDISAFRCEIVEILKGKGMNTSSVSGQGAGKQIERMTNENIFTSYCLVFFSLVKNNNENALYQKNHKKAKFACHKLLRDRKLEY